MYSRDFIKNQRKRPMFLTDEKINFFKRVLTKFWIKDVSENPAKTGKYIRCMDLQLNQEIENDNFA